VRSMQDACVARDGHACVIALPCPHDAMPTGHLGWRARGGRELQRARERSGDRDHGDRCRDHGDATRTVTLAGKYPEISSLKISSLNIWKYTSTLKKKKKKCVLRTVRDTSSVTGDFLLRVLFLRRTPPRHSHSACYSAPSSSLATAGSCAIQSALAPALHAWAPWPPGLFATVVAAWRAWGRRRIPVALQITALLCVIAHHRPCVPWAQNTPPRCC
jgi:hypothetical protein